MNESIETLAPKITCEKPGSFAYATALERWPKILGKIVDHFHRNRPKLMKEYGEEADADVKLVIHDLSEMRYRMGTDKPIENLNDNFYDVDEWNKMCEAFREQDEQRFTWFKHDWLFVECYLYRKVYSAVQKTKLLRDYDWFAEQKDESLEDHIEQTKELLEFLHEKCQKKETHEEIRSELITLLKISLWGNKADLSLSGGEKSQQAKSPVESAAARDEYLLVDHFEKVADHLMNLKGNRQVDIILDNAGFELMGDLMIGEFLLAHKLADRVVFHGKEYPWFVSDVIKRDFVWTFDRLTKIDQQHSKWAGDLWKQRLQNNSFTYKADHFWTTPYAFYNMEKHAPALYKDLSQSSLLIFKGDLNFRKLTGDRYWPHVTPFEVTLRGFKPCPLLALRAMKAQTAPGLTEETVAKMKAKFGEDSYEWMVTGDYAVAQLAE
ncbi:unnamed protein product, partial [Mesorhabditis belari]|uniref:Sugar phosphate phosphatase n=1 Tax=Mesorhabditis belari TaxID=2138241 RepID=A0AAF3EBL2_9BILA